MESHNASPLMLQLTLEVTENAALPALEPKERLAGDIVSMAASPDWVIVTILVIPPPVTVTIPMRGLVEGLAVTATCAVSSFVPLVGDTETQVALLLMLQLILEAMENVVLPDPAPKERAVGNMVNAAAAPDCETATVLVIPAPATVTIALREPVEGLAATTTVTAASLEPPAGDTEIHDAPLFVLQLILELTENVELADPAPKERLSGDTVNAAASPDWDTANVLVIPPPVTVTTPPRWLVEGLADTVTVTVVSFVPLAGATEIQDASSLALQLMLEVTVNFTLPEPEPKERLVGERINAAAAPDCITVTVLEIPPPDMITVPLRALIEEFVETVTVALA
jgi:hypothetical protein